MLKKIGFALCAGFLSIIIFMSGILNNTQLGIADTVFQTENVLDGNIFVIGIDTKSLNDLGAFHTWKRNYMADVIDKLNADPNNRPAAIGVDVMYFGETPKEESDYLVEVCKKYDNIVMASNANFKSVMQLDENGKPYMDDYYIYQYEEPFDALKAVTEIGHINAMADIDGIIRSNLHEITLSDGSVSKSFASQMYKLYASKNGLSLDVKPPINSRGQWYIPFSAKSGGYYDNYSFSDLLNGELPADMFGGSVVIIGPYATGLMDDYITAIDHTSRTYGVEIHANIVDALVRQDFKEYANKIPQIFLLFAVVFICVLAYEKLRPFFSVLILLFGTVGYLFLAKFVYQNGIILDVLHIPLFVIVSYVFMMVKNYVTESIEKKRVTDTFKRYVDPSVVNEILKTGALNLKGQTTSIACLFVDVRGFTTMSEALKPEEVVDILNEYFMLTSTCIFNNGGTLDKFIGDAAMAIFNAPLPLDDYVFLAVKTAIDIAKGSEELENKLFKKFGKTVSFGIGINTGEAIVGNIGTPFRMDYTAIGNTVNTASRLESNAKPGQILISLDVYEQVKNRVLANSIGVIPLKGKNEEIEVFVVEKLITE